MSKIYNTGLKSSKYFHQPIRDQLDETDFHEDDKGIIFYQDMARIESLDLRFLKNVQCIYSEIAWVKAYDTFLERANRSNSSSYFDYICGIRYLVHELKKPTFIVCSKATAKSLDAHEMRTIKLNGDECTLAIFYLNDHLPRFEDTEQLLEHLSNIYIDVFDFSCGYGNTFKKFSHFIGCDIDMKCLDYVKKEFFYGDYQRDKTNTDKPN